MKVEMKIGAEAPSFVAPEIKEAARTRCRKA